MNLGLVRPGSSSLDGDTHAAGRAGYHAHGAFHGEAVQVGHFVLRDHFYLRPGNFSNFITIWLFTAALQFSRFQQLYRCRRSLDDEVEGLVGINCDETRENLPYAILGPGIELLTELHDIDAFRT